MVAHAVIPPQEAEVKDCKFKASLNNLDCSWLKALRKRKELGPWISSPALGGGNGS